MHGAQPLHGIRLLIVQKTAFIQNVVQMFDLLVQIVDFLLVLIFPLLGDLEHFVGLFQLALQELDGVRVFLGHFDGPINFGGVCDDISVELAAFLEQFILVLMTGFHGSI